LSCDLNYNQQSLNVFVDYAHTPDALENVLSTLKSLPHKRLICVFGAGGNRDKSKRPLMMDAVTKFSDVIIVTSDNPRNEKPEDIINEIVAQSKNSDKVFIERDRKLAIELALKIADENDIVFINTISTDSRNIKQNTLFFAIKGDKFDGHQYVNQVIEDKSNLAIVSNNIAKVFFLRNIK